MINIKLQELLRENPQYKLYVHRIVYDEYFTHVLHTVKYDAFYEHVEDNIVWDENAYIYNSINLDETSFQYLLDDTKYLLFRCGNKPYILNVVFKPKVEEEIICVQ